MIKVDQDVAGSNPSGGLRGDQNAIKGLSCLERDKFRQDIHSFKGIAAKTSGKTVQGIVDYHHGGVIILILIVRHQNVVRVNLGSHAHGSSSGHGRRSRGTGEWFVALFCSFFFFFPGYIYVSCCVCVSDITLLN